MNYEPAKRLKDAGFPQEDRHWYWCSFTYPNTLWCINALKAKKLDKEYECMTANPTLSELIEACGDVFCELRQLNPKYHSMPIDGMRWEASSPEVTPMLYVASTPEEAVANLWLALNKK